MRRLFAFALVAGLAACGGSGSSGVTTPVTTLAPAPTPTPTATPNPFAAACGTPLPNPEDSYGFGIKVQLEPSKSKKIINASPLVKNAMYCLLVETPGEFCRTRKEDNPERVPCDHYMSGISHTGQPGPNWFQVVNGQMLECG